MQALRVQAAQQHVSMEEEVRRILRNAVRLHKSVFFSVNPLNHLEGSDLE